MYNKIVNKDIGHGSLLIEDVSWSSKKSDILYRVNQLELCIKTCGVNAALVLVCLSLTLSFLTPNLKISKKQTKNVFYDVYFATERMAAFTLIQKNRTNRAIAPRFVLIQPNLTSVNTI